MIVYEPPTRHAFTPQKVVLLSGLSNPATCGLSAVQKQFLAGLHVPEAWKVYWNFPYLACPEGSDTPLWRASLHNFQQFILASGRRYRRAARAHSRALVHSTEHLLVVALSCGLEILNSVLAAGDGIPGTGPHMLRGSASLLLVPWPGKGRPFRTPSFRENTTISRSSFFATWTWSCPDSDTWRTSRTRGLPSW